MEHDDSGVITNDCNIYFLPWMCRGKDPTGRVCGRQRAIHDTLYSPVQVNKNRSFQSTKCRESGGECSARSACIPCASGAPPLASEALESIKTTEEGDAKHIPQVKKKIGRKTRSKRGTKHQTYGRSEGTLLWQLITTLDNLSQGRFPRSTMVRGRGGGGTHVMHWP